MERQINVAVVGVPGVVGEALLAALEQRRFPLGQVFLLDEESAVGESLRYFGRSLKVESAAGFDFTQCELAFFCGDAEQAHAHAYAAAESGCLVIDMTGAFRLEPGVPLVIPEVNPEALDDFRERNIVAVPSPATLLLLAVLKPLHDAAEVVRADVVSCESASRSGKAGIEELSGQTIALMNMRETQPSVFSERLAFNIIPQVGPLSEEGDSEAELEMVTEAQKILGVGGITVNPTVLQVPVFFGHSLAVHLQTAAPLSADEARAILGEQSAITLMESPTPAVQGVNQDQILVGRLRDAVGATGGLKLWITSDNSRKGAALSAVQIAEQLEKCYI